MFTVEHLVSDVRRMAGEGDYKGLAAYLISNADNLITIDCRAVVEALDAQAHTLGFMAALCVNSARNCLILNGHANVVTSKIS